jgi:Uma2 family endonuclease
MRRLKLISMAVLEDIVAGRAPGPISFTVEQFHKMLADGIVREGQPVELIDGMVMQKNRAAVGEAAMVHGRRHAVTVARIQRLIERHVGQRDCHVRTQLPLTLSDRSEPEPDLAVVEGMAARYLDHHPAACETLLLIEVADSSLDYDRKAKSQLYAAAGIGNYWIVNLVDDVIEVYESPRADEQHFARRTIHNLGGCVMLQVSANESIALPVNEIIPSRV